MTETTLCSSLYTSKEKWWPTHF